MRYIKIACASLVLAVGLAGQAGARPFDVEDLVRLARVSDPALSPDGRLVVYTLRETDIEADRGATSLWLVPSDGSAPPRRLTGERASASSPRWSPGGDLVYFLSDRSGSAQVWALPLQGGEARQVTHLPVPVRTYVVAPGGDRLALALSVFPECDDLECTRSRLDERGRSKATGVLHEQLFVRHWDSWKDGRQSRLFIADLDREGRAGPPRLLSRGVNGDVPTRPFGDASEIAFSPDGAEVVFAARLADPGEPWSTNVDLWSASTTGEEPARNLTAENAATDTTPAFSPDGRTLAWLAMERPGFEADRYRILLRDVRSGDTREIAPDWDRSAHGLEFSPDGRTLYTWSDDLGHRRLFAIDVRSGRVQPISGDGTVGGYSVARTGVVFVRQDLASPGDLYRVNPRGGGERRLTAHNAERLSGVEFGEYQQFSFSGAGGARVYGWVVKPVGFEAGRKYPAAFIVHGGPQGSMGNNFHYRWNPQTYAGQGYVAVFIDFHGSTGYGQAFTDAISGDWGGKPLEDLQRGWTAALQQFDFIDADRACALGASYGGYMVNWIAGAWPDGFACLVNHCGIFDNRSMYYSTEELWFPEWEMGGPHFGNPAGFERHNPVNLVNAWRTPMLVIHGANDFRVPLEQGLATFTALQRRGIPSQFLYFPDENHWVLKPANSVQWHRAVEAWLQRWTDRD